MSDESSNLRRVGYWWSEKKSRKFNLKLFAQLCKNAGLELVKIDLEKTFEEQGPFVAIVHKLSDFIVKAQQGDAQAHAICQALEDYLSRHPEVVVIDPLSNMKKLLDRYRQYKLIENSGLRERGVAFVPPFVEMTTRNVSENLAQMEAAGVTFPFVCKPSLAHASALAHEMCIVFNMEGLNDITPPCVAQKFINHNAVLYKLFVIGDKYFVVERPSLKNFIAGDQKTIFFNSHRISKPDSSSVLNELDATEPKTPTVRPEKERLDQIVHVLAQNIGLNLCGIDVVVDNSTEEYAIVDVNLFPGYDEVDNFFQLLCDLIVQKIDEKAKRNQEEPCDSANSSLPKTHSSCSHFPFEMGKESCTAVIPYSCRCICCPITGVCDNVSQESHSASRHRVTFSPELAEVLQNTEAKEKPSDEKGDVFCSPDSAQDDSGIETSDSCDEKKKKAASVSKVVKRQHSRNHGTPLALEGTV